MELEFHEYANLFPLLEGREFDLLVEDIKEHGQHELIVLFNGKILDGRNRYLACKQLGIAPRIRDLNCTDGHPLDYVWSANVTRRHLNPGQRALAIVKRMKFIPHGGRPSDAVITIDQAAEIAKVSDGTISRAKYLLAHGTEQDIKDVESGDKLISPTVSSLKRKPPRQYHTTRVYISYSYDCGENTIEGIYSSVDKAVASWKLTPSQLKKLTDPFNQEREFGFYLIEYELDPHE